MSNQTCPFNSAAGLVRWVLNDGRERMEGSRAIDYARHGTTRGPRPKAYERNGYAMESMQEQFAFAVKSMRGLTPEQLSLLTMAYRGVEDGAPRAVVEGRLSGQSRWLPPLSDVKIAARLGISQPAVSRRRHAALRVVAARARELGMIPAETRGATWPTSQSAGWRRSEST